MLSIQELFTGCGAANKPHQKGRPRCPLTTAQAMAAGSSSCQAKTVRAIVHERMASSQVKHPIQQALHRQNDQLGAQ
jgi:hypothetical protein